jgi:hypothetical protein
MSGSVSMSFSSPPSLWLAYPRMFLARRPALLPEGREVPTIEARLNGLQARAEHLQAYDACVASLPTASRRSRIRMSWRCR